MGCLDQPFATPPTAHLLRVPTSVVLFPDPTPIWKKGSGILQAISGASMMQNGCVILIILSWQHIVWYVVAYVNDTGLICAASALSHEKLHVMSLTGAINQNCHAIKLTRSTPDPSSLCMGGVWDQNYY